MERIETDNVHKIWFLCGRNVDVHQEGVIFYTLTSDYTQEQIDSVTPEQIEGVKLESDRIVVLAKRMFEYGTTDDLRQHLQGDGDPEWESKWKAARRVVKDNNPFPT